MNKEVIEQKNTDGEQETKAEAEAKTETSVETQNHEDDQKKATKASRDFYKPQYIDFFNPLFVNLFGKLTVNLKDFVVTLEEKYPLKTQLPEFNGNLFSTEQIFQINFPSKNNMGRGKSEVLKNAEIK